MSAALPAEHAQDHSDAELRAQRILKDLFLSKPHHSIKVILLETESLVNEPVRMDCIESMCDEGLRSWLPPYGIVHQQGR